MAIAIGTVAPASPPEFATAANGASHSYSVTTTADTDVVVILVGAYNSAIVTNGTATCTWDGGSISELDFRTQAGSFADDAYVQAFLVTSPGSPGSHNLVLTLPGAGGSITRDFLSVAIPLEGVDTGALPTGFDAENGATTGTAVSVSVPTTVGNLILTVGGTFDTGQSAHTGSLVAQYDFGADNHIFGAWNVMSTVADANPEAIGWTATTTDDWMIAALDFTPDAGGGATDLVVADVAVVVVADNVTLTQVHTLAVADVAVVVAADNVTLTQVHQLVVADVAVTVVADNVVLTQVHNLVVADVAVTVVADNVVLTQVHTLEVADVAVVVVADNVELDAGGVTNLVVPDVAVVVVADNVVLTQVHQLVVADVAVIVVADVVELETEGFELTERQAVHATLIGTAANVVTLTGSFARAQIVNHDAGEPLYVFASSTGATPPVVTAAEAGSRIVPAIGVLSMRVTGTGFVATVVGDGNSYSVVGYDNPGDGLVTS
jgi:hypothetical protein